MDMDNIHSVRSACEVVNASPSTVATTLDYDRTRRARDEERRDDVGEERSGNGGTAIRSLLSSPPQHTGHGSGPAGASPAAWGREGSPRATAATTRHDHDTRGRGGESKSRRADTTARQKQQRPREAGSSKAASARTRPPML